MTQVNPVLTAQIELASAFAAAIQNYEQRLRSMACREEANARQEQKATQLNLNSGHHFDGIQLSDLAASLPTSRTSLFEIMKALGIATAKAPGVNGRGRIAWLTHEQAERIRCAAFDVAAGRATISELDERPSGKISRSKLLCVINEFLPGYAQDRETYRVSEFRRHCEPHLNGFLGKEDFEKDCDNRPKWHGRFDYAHKDVAIHLGFSVASNGSYRTK